jgi:nitrite reductase/ring-hydroxylating ferredoxin subunit
MTDVAVGEFRTVARSEAVPDDLVVPFYVEDRKRRVSIARVGKRLHAFDYLCTCSDEPCPLSGGLLKHTTIMCQCHGSEFDIVTGAVLEGPARKPLAVHAVREVEGVVQVGL